MLHKILPTLVSFALTTFAVAQTPYTYTLPQMEGYGLQSWTPFTFPGTPNTVGDATLDFDWLACYQGGFGTNGVEIEIRVGASSYISVLDYTGGTVECSFQPRNVTIPATLMQQALAYTGGTGFEGRVRVDDACQPGVGCSFYNDPVVRQFTLAYTTTAANFTSPDAINCPGEVVHFTDASINSPSSHSWSFPGGNPATSTLPNPVVQYTAPGSYPVTLTVMTVDGESTMTVADFVTIHDLPIATAGADQFVCEGELVALQGGGGSTYSWFPIESLSDPTIAGPVASPVASPVETTTYTVLVTSAQGCQASDQVLVTVVPQPIPVVDNGGGVLCSGDSLELTGTGAEFYTWSPNLFISSTSGANVTVWPTADQSWTVVGTDLYGCIGEATINVVVVPAATTPLITWDDMVLSSTVGDSYQWYLQGEALIGATQQTWIPAMNGNYTVMITDVNGCTAVSEGYYFGSVGIQVPVSETLRVYPQPAKGALNVTGAHAGDGYRMLDAQGRIVRSGIFHGPTVTVDIRDLAAGMHILEVGTEAVVRLQVVVE